MEQIQINELKVISPMFSYGNKGVPEPRPTELKGLIRNTYRIANPKLDLQTLYKREATLLGGQLKKQEGNKIIPSPLRIQMSEKKKDPQTTKQGLRLHRKESYKKNGKLQKNLPISMYSIDTLFGIKLFVNFDKDEALPSSFINSESPVEWYTDLLYLSLLLGGIGKRSRRGRGCMTTDKLQGITENDLPNRIVKLLNGVGGEKNYASEKREISIINEKDKNKNRPYIRKIRFGNIIAYPTKRIIESYLLSVDYTSHKARGKSSGFKYPCVLGCASPRFNSSVIVSLAGIKGGVIPIYTSLNVAGEPFETRYGDLAWEEQYKKEQQIFISMIEEARRN